MKQTTIDICKTTFPSINVVGTTKEAAIFMKSSGVRLRCICKKCGKSFVMSKAACEFVKEKYCDRLEDVDCSCFTNKLAIYPQATPHIREIRVGVKINLLTIVEIDYSYNETVPRLKCRCECGNETTVRGNNLVNGYTKSCGCLNKTRKVYIDEENAATNKTKERLYGVWLSMKKRCDNTNSPAYPDYGGRGIKVCKSWHVYEHFREWALSAGYDKDADKFKCTLDRIDVNKDYKPSNCRWVSMAVQNQNKRGSITAKYKGKEHTLSYWSEKLNIDYDELCEYVRQGIKISKILKLKDTKDKKE